MQSCILPSTQSKRYLKPELDSRRMDLLHSKIFSCSFEESYESDKISNDYQFIEHCSYLIY